MEAQKGEFLEGLPDRLIFKKINRKQMEMKSRGFNENGIDRYTVIAGGGTINGKLSCKI